MVHKLVRTGQEESGMEASGRAQPILWDVRPPSVGVHPLLMEESKPNFLIYSQAIRDVCPDFRIPALKKPWRTSASWGALDLEAGMAPLSQGRLLSLICWTPLAELPF